MWDLRPVGHLLPVWQNSSIFSLTYFYTKIFCTSFFFVSLNELKRSYILTKLLSYFRLTVTVNDDLWRIPFYFILTKCLLYFRLTVTVNDDLRKIPLYSIHSNPANSFEFCVGGRDHFIRYVNMQCWGKQDIGSDCWGEDNYPLDERSAVSSGYYKTFFASNTGHHHLPEVLSKNKLNTIKSN